MVHSPLIRPYLLGGGSFWGGTLDSHDNKQNRILGSSTMVISVYSTMCHDFWRFICDLFLWFFGELGESKDLSVPGLLMIITLPETYLNSRVMCLWGCLRVVRSYVRRHVRRHVRYSGLCNTYVRYMVINSAIGYAISHHLSHSRRALFSFPSHSGQVL